MSVTLEAAIDEIAESLRSGNAISNADLKNKFAHLVPELENVVQELRSIIRAELEIESDHRLKQADPELASIRTVLDDSLPGYRIDDVIYRGGQGTVLKAFQESVQRHVAIKVMHDSPVPNARRSRRFAREIQLISQLQLPNIVRVFESGVAAGHPYFIMEYVEGVSVDDYALANQLSAKARMELMHKIICAVSRAHQRGVIHRDLKPSNILIDVEGEPHILDFGLAKALRRASEPNSSEDVSLEGHVIGTLPYLSPEQATGFDEVDVRSDIYALGIILFELLTGFFPYDVYGDKAEARAQIINEAPKRLKESVSDGDWTGFPGPQEFDDDIQAIVSLALAKSTSERYQTCESFADDLQRYLSGNIVKARSDQRLYLLRRICRKYWIEFASVAVVMLALIVATTVSTFLWFEAKRERDSARKVATLAEDTLDHVVTGIDQQLEALAGGKELRRHLLDGVSQRLSDLYVLVKEDQGLDNVAASLSEKEADIARSEGRKQEARHLYLRAAEILTQLQIDDLSTHLARLHRKAGMCSDDGKEHFDESIEFARSAIRKPSGDSNAELANSLLAAANNDYLNGRHIESAERIEEALGLLRSRGDSMWILAEALERQGDVSIELGRLGQSCKSFRESIKLCENLLAKRPFDVRIRQKRMMLSTKLGSALAMSNQLDEAIGHSRSALDDSVYLLEADSSNLEYLRTHLSTATRFAMILRQHGDHQAALDAVTKSVQRAQAHTDSSNQSYEILRQLGFALIERSRINRDLGANEAAVADARKALSIRKTLAKQLPTNLDYSHEVAAAHDLLGVCLQRVDRHAEAHEHLIDSCAIHRGLVDEQPDVPIRHLSLAQSNVNLASWHMRSSSDESNSKAIEILRATRSELENLERETSEIRENSDFTKCISVINANLERLEQTQQPNH